MAFYDVVTYLSNQELHGSSWSLGRLIQARPAGGGISRLAMRTGAEDDLVELAVRWAWWLYSQTIELVLEEFAEPLREELDALCDRAAEAFVPEQADKPPAG